MLILMATVFLTTLLCLYRGSPSPKCQLQATENQSKVHSKPLGFFVAYKLYVYKMFPHNKIQRTFSVLELLAVLNTLFSLFALQL